MKINFLKYATIIIDFVSFNRMILFLGDDKYECNKGRKHNAS